MAPVIDGVVSEPLSSMGAQWELHEHIRYSGMHMVCSGYIALYKNVLQFFINTHFINKNSEKLKAFYVVNDVIVIEARLKSDMLRKNYIDGKYI